MTLFFRRDEGTAGMGSVFPMSVFAHLLQISDFDMGLGETNAGGNLMQVTYHRNNAGPAPERLDVLVNTDFPVTATNVDIIILGTDNGFVLNNGEVLEVGATIGPNTIRNGVNVNPSDSVLVIYDTTVMENECVQREGGGMDLPTTNAIVLFHELSHAFRFCTGTVADRTDPPGCGSSDEERASIVDENLFRDQLHRAHRDPGNNCGTRCAGGGGCCIVASVASGSAFSSEVNALRDVRDRFLRRSEIGFDFFDRLHDDYYRFSPQVCRMMAKDERLRQFIASFFVRPLAAMLDLIHRYTAMNQSAEEIGAAFAALMEQRADLGAALDEAQKQLAALRGSTEDMPWQPLAELLRDRALPSDTVRWALIEVLLMFADAVEWSRAGMEPPEIGRRLALAIDAWGTRMPLTPVWPTLSRYTLARELDFLKRALLRTPGAREVIARRLVETFGSDPRIAAVLEEERWLDRGEAG